MTPRRSLVWWAVLAVTVCGVAATAHGLYGVAVACGIVWWVAWLWPVMADGLALAAYSALSRLAHRAARAYAWLVVVTAAGLSGAAQGAIGVGLGEPTGLLRFGVWAAPAPVVAVAAHLFWLVRNAEGVPAAPGDAGRDPQIEAPPPPGDTSDGVPVLRVPALSANGNGHGVTKVEKAVAVLLAYEEEHGRRPPRDRLAALAGCSSGTAQAALARTKAK